MPLGSAQPQFQIPTTDGNPKEEEEADPRDPISLFPHFLLKEQELKKRNLTVRIGCFTEYAAQPAPLQHPPLPLLQLRH